MYKFPFTNFHALNLDWFLSQWNTFLAKIDDKIASVAGITADADSVPYSTPASVEVTGGSGTDNPYHMQFHIPRGIPVTITSTSTTYASSASGTVVPSAESFGTTIPTVLAGDYLWTRVLTTYSDGTVSTAYSTARQGIDGMGAVDSVNGEVGAVMLTAEDIPYNSSNVDEELSYQQSLIDENSAEIGTLTTNVSSLSGAVDNLTPRVSALESATSVTNVTGFSLGSEATSDGGTVVKRIGKLVQLHLNVNMKNSDSWSYNHALVGLPHAVSEGKYFLEYPKKGALYIYPTGEANLQWFEAFTAGNVRIDVVYFAQ